MIMVQRVYGTWTHSGAEAKRWNANKLFAEHEEGGIRAVIPVRIVSHDKPRYQIQSPLQFGNYTLSVRELSGEQVSNLKRRGFQIKRVASNVALSKPITISKDVLIPTSFEKRQRVGIGEKRITRRVQTEPRSVILKSSYSPRNLFMETQFAEPKSGLQEYRDLDRNRIIRVTPETAARLISRNGWRLQKVSTSGGRTPGQTTRSDERGEQMEQHEDSQKLNADTQNLQVELRNLKAWLSEVNERTSRQLTDLGVSTTQRSQKDIEIEKRLEEQKKWIESINKRVSEQLVALGEAVSNVSKAVAIKDAEKVVEDIKKGPSGIMGGITSFFSTPSNYILIVIVVVMLLMLRSKIPGLK